MSETPGENTGGSRARTPAKTHDAAAPQEATDENSIANDPKLSNAERQRALDMSIQAAQDQRNASMGGQGKPSVDDEEDRRRRLADVNKERGLDGSYTGLDGRKGVADLKEANKGLPPEWRDRLLPNRNEFVLRDEPKVAVFSVSADTLKTRLNDPEVAKLLAATADERGWSRIQVKGTETFRREVWIEATARGVDTKGFQPSEVDFHEASLRSRNFQGRNQVKADRQAIENLEPGTMARRNEQHRMVAAAVGATHAHLRDKVSNSSDQRVIEQAVRDSLAKTNGRQVRDIKMRDPEGTVVKMGYENYKFDPKESRSFYMRLEKDGKTRDVWGVGLADAATKSKTSLGDYVQVHQTGAKPVEVMANVRDKEGRITGTTQKQVMRKEYQVDVQERATSIRAPEQSHQNANQQARIHQQTQEQSRSRGRSR